MKRSSPLALLFSALVFTGVGTAFAAETQTVASFQKTVSKTVGYQYLLSLPTGYDAASDKKWPVILFLHGSGERGSDPWLVAKHGPPMLIRGEVPATKPATDTKGPPAPAAPAETPEARARREEAATALRNQFIVISPQCPSGPWWDDDGVIGLLDEVMARHKTDPSRVYLTGLSMGGYGTWSVGLKYPERFAAIVPVCGGGSFRDLLSAPRPKREAILALGIRVFHGAKDPTVPLSESENMVNALKKYGVKDLELTVYPEAKHDSWTETYNQPELYAWLLKHQRNEKPVAK